MIKMLLTIFCLMLLQRSTISSCCAIDINGTITFSKKHLEYKVSERESNETKLPHQEDETKLKEDLMKLNDFVVPFTWNSFSKYSEKIVRDVERQLKSEGNFKLTALAYSINRHLDGKVYIFSVLKDISKDFTIELNAYFDSMLQQKITCKIEEEFYILDLLETVHKIFATKCKTLLNDLKHQAKGNLQLITSRMLLQETENYIVNQKSDNLNYLCEKLELCAIFPAFSDYVAELLNDILELPDEKMLNIVRKIKEVLESETIFLENNIISKNVTNIIRNKLQSLPDNISDARYFFSIVRDILRNRFNIFKSKDGTIKARSISVRILIDMIDRTYELLGHQYNKFNYNVMKKSIKIWAKGKGNDLQMTLKNYIDNFEHILKLNWPSEVIQEAKILIKVFIMGTAKINEKYHYLFIGGSSIDRVFFQNGKFPTNVLY